MYLYFRSWSPGTRTIYHTVRLLRLDGIFIFVKEIFGKIQTSQGHVAIYKDRRAAFISASVHMIGVGSVCTLSYFVMGNYYIGVELSGIQNQDDQKMLGIQIAAKLFELVAVFSLTSMIFTLVRYEHALGNGVPLAAMVAGLQISDPTFLVSKTLLAIFKGHFSKTWTKVGFIVLIVFSTLLAVLIAPASATALAPRFGRWRVGGARVRLNASESALFPDILNETHSPVGLDCQNVSGDTLCPSSSWENIAEGLLSRMPRSVRFNDWSQPDGDWLRSKGELPGRPDEGFLPFQIQVRGGRSVLDMFISVRHEFYQILWAPYTWATLPHSATTDGLVSAAVSHLMAMFMSFHNGETVYWLTKARFYGSNVMCATAHVRCISQTITISNLSATKLSFAGSGVYLDIDANYPSLRTWLHNTLPNMTRPQITWFDVDVDLDPRLARHISIGTLLLVPNDPKSDSAQLNICFNYARWVWGRAGIDTFRSSSNCYHAPALGGPPIQHVPVDNTGPIWITDPSWGKHVQIRPSFAQLLNPVTTISIAHEPNLTVIQSLLAASHSWKPLQTGLHFPGHVEAILAALIVNGMSRLSPSFEPLLTIADADGPWWRTFLPVTEFGPAGENAYLATTEEQANYFSVELEAGIEGYGYDNSETATQLAMACLYAYAGIVLLFLVWSLWSGITSTSWDTVLELVVMALKSPPTAEGAGRLAGVSAGVTSTGPLRQRYVMAVEGSGITLAAMQGQGSLPKEKRVKVNQVYI
ncbi:hypothetical protein QBC39DRAFT_20157 [Podospora conica]|nr:hypothetical protein QBC39DRAFT_20157 [Schizothecium conicum]